MKFGFGPMSTEIIEAIYQYSHDYNIELMLIISKNQADYCGGYVNNWNTERFVQHLDTQKKKYPNAQIMICRDHCGPMSRTKFNDFTDTKETIKEDIRCGFDLIHIDLCYYTGDVLYETGKLLHFTRNLNPNTELEIGTDEIGEQFSYEQLNQELKIFKEFDPLYYVVNTGSLIKENKQVGTFNQKNVRLAHELLDECGIGLKEHNSDYLSSEQIKKRDGIVEAMNIAPQLGVVQTITVLAECQKYGINVDDFVNKVYNSYRWCKWDNGNLKGNPYLSTIVAGHYLYTSDEYKRLAEPLYDELKYKIIQNIKDIIANYANSQN